MKTSTHTTLTGENVNRAEWVSNGIHWTVTRYDCEDRVTVYWVKGPDEYDHKEMYLSQVDEYIRKVTHGKR